MVGIPCGVYQSRKAYADQQRWKDDDQQYGSALGWGAGITFLWPVAIVIAILGQVAKLYVPAYHQEHKVVMAAKPPKEPPGDKHEVQRRGEYY